MIQAEDGRQVVPAADRPGLLQLDRRDADGAKPHGMTRTANTCRSGRLARRSDQSFHMSDEPVQKRIAIRAFYHRRMCWLARGSTPGDADADHTLSFMDFVKPHRANDDYGRPRAYPASSLHRHPRRRRSSREEHAGRAISEIHEDSK